MKIYIAAPLFSAAERDWNAKLASSFRQRCTADIALPQDFCKGIQEPRLIASKCLTELSSSNLVVINADGADVDSGTSFEAGFAYAMRIETISYRTDFRRAGDCDNDVSLMIGYTTRFLDCIGDTPDTIASKILKEVGY